MRVRSAGHPDGTRGRSIAIVTLGVLLLTSCVHKTTVIPDYGLPENRGSASTRDAQSKAPQSEEAAKPEIPSIRDLFQQQTQGAFDPRTEDARVQILQNRVRLNPQDAASRLELASLFEGYRLYDDSLEQYAEALRLARSAPGANSPLAEQSVRGLGRSARAAGRNLEVIPILETLSQESPSATCWGELGLLYDAVGNLETGEKALKEAIARDPKSAFHHNNLGYNLLLQNKEDLAEVEFRKALDLDPRSATAQNNLGVVLARCGDFEGAIRQFRKNGDAAAAHNNLAVVLLEMGQLEKSHDELMKALNARPYFGPALMNLRVVQDRLAEKAANPESSAIATPARCVKSSQDVRKGQ